MFRKTALAFALTTMMAMPAALPAQAGVDLDISINLGYGGFYGKNISCKTGYKIVKQRFNSVVTRDCSGRYYSYTGWRNGKRFVIKVNANTGRIVDVDRIW